VCAPLVEISARHHETIFELYRELRFRGMPLDRRVLPLRGDVAERQPYQLGRRFIVREMTAPAHGFAHFAVQTFDRVGRVDDRRTAAGKAKKGITCSQLRRQLCAIAGYFWPQAPAANSSSRVAAALADSAP